MPGSLFLHADDSYLITCIGIENSGDLNGCLSKLTLAPWEYKAFVPKSVWRSSSPTITQITPGHDERIHSPVQFGEQTTLPIQIRFSSDMECDSVIGSLEIDSTSYYGLTATLNKSSIRCKMEKSDPPPYV
jgi:alpha-1,3-glucan synthase